MSARVKRQIGYALLGAVLLAFGAALGATDGDSDGPASFIGGVIALIGVLLAGGYGLALIFGLIRSED